MSREGRADIQLFAQRNQDALDHSAHGNSAALSGPIAVVERFGARVQAFQPGARRRNRNEIEETVGALENRERLRGDLAGDAITRAHNGKGPASQPASGGALDRIWEERAG